jgi:hypothetical protein
MGQNTGIYISPQLGTKFMISVETKDGTAKGACTTSEELNAQMSPLTYDEHNLPAHEDYWQEH